MIDQLIALGALGMPQPHHQTCLSTVSYSRFLHAKAKPTTTFIKCPITGAQIDLVYWVEDVGGVPTAFCRISIPLATATMGHNYLHAGLASLPHEVKCAALLIKVTLLVLGFTTEEVTRFMQSCKPELVELTWHTDTASPRAKRNLQKRTKKYFDAQLSMSGRHDVGVSDVDYKEGNGKPGLLVTLKNGDKYRQYGKIDQVQSRTRKGRNKGRMPDATLAQQPYMLKKIETHVRNELLIGPATLKHFKQEHPGSWTVEAFTNIVDYVWEYMGFPVKGTTRNLTGRKLKLSPEAEATWQGYLVGNDMSKVLPSHTFTRHRASIKSAKGQDIAVKYQARAARPENVGYQLCYARHCEPTGDERKLVLCEETAPAIVQELRWGVAFLESGEIPEFDDVQAREKWLSRWKGFMDRERGGHRLKQVDEPAPSSPPLPPLEMRHRKCSGISDAPVQADVQDQIIMFEGELMLI